MFARLNNPSKITPLAYEPDKKVTLVGETDSRGNMFITNYRKEPSTMGQTTLKVEIDKARTLTSPFPPEPAPAPLQEPEPVTEPAPEPAIVVPAPQPKEKLDGGKSRRYKKTGKKQKGRKSRKQRK